MRFFRLRLVGALLLGIVLISSASTYFDVLAHRHSMRADLARRTHWFGAGLRPVVEQNLGSAAGLDWNALLHRLRPQPDLPGVVLIGADGRTLASAGPAPPIDGRTAALSKESMSEGREMDAFLRGAGPAGGGRWYEDAIPLHEGNSTAGVMLVAADAGYIHAEEMGVLRRSFLRVAAIVLLVVVVTLLTVRWFFQQPVSRAADWLRKLRRGEAGVEEGAREFGDLAPLAREVSSLAENLNQARVAAATEARLRDQAENIWTAERLAVHVRDRLAGGQLIVVSNREPYMHVSLKGRTECVVPPSGLVTAIEPILLACDGTWIAHGSGSDDAAYVDGRDRLRVPPGDGRYTLRRVWLSAEEEAGYYEGFSNEGLWPLCHIAHTRPSFRAADWAYYRSVNEKFAEAVVEEIRGKDHPAIFVQDYHFALLPRLIKEKRPDARVAIFWHIPWPNPEAFAICPWGAELVDGLLGADVLGFHTQAHCNNFLQTVDRVLEARTDWEEFAIRRNGHTSAVRPYPISVAWGGEEGANAERAPARSGGNGHMHQRRLFEVSAGKGKILPIDGVDDEEADSGNLRRELGIEGGQMLLGVDRMDYTKGIVERLLAVEHLLENHAELRGGFTFVQIAAPSRTKIPRYAELRIEVEATVERINQAYRTQRWKPVILIERQCSHQEVGRYYRASDVCLVTSLHDGMNLVAKEFVAARSGGDGVLILSRFTGASQELRDALLVNPYDTAQVSEAIAAAINMAPADRRMRMKRMRSQVRENNVYRWAANILADLCSVRFEEDLQVASAGSAQKMPA